MTKIIVTWRSEHDVDPPDGVTEEAFRARLEDREWLATEHAVKQIDRSAAEPARIDLDG